MGPFWWSARLRADRWEDISFRVEYDGAVLQHDCFGTKPHMFGLVSDVNDPYAPAIWVMPDGERFSGTTTSVGRRIESLPAMDSEDKDDLLFIEEYHSQVYYTTATEGFYSLEELRWNLAGNSYGAYNLLQMAHKLGLRKGYLANGPNGKQYVILKGYSGLYKHLPGTRYLASNPKVYDFVACKTIGKQLTGPALKLSIISSVLISAIHGFLDGERGARLGVTMGADALTAALGFLAGAGTTVAVTTALGTAVCPVIGTAAGFIVGCVVTYALNRWVEKYDVKGIIYEGIKAAEARIMIKSPLGTCPLYDLTPPLLTTRAWYESIARTKAQYVQ